MINKWKFKAKTPARKIMNPEQISPTAKAKKPQHFEHFQEGEDLGWEELSDAQLAAVVGGSITGGSSSSTSTTTTTTKTTTR